LLIVVVYQSSSQACGAGFGDGLDASSTVAEHERFDASRRWGLVSTFCQRWEGSRSLTCLDVFSASRKFQRAFERRGHTAQSFDVKNNPEDDITSRRGFLKLVDLGMQFLSRILHRHHVV
jgi:hypothetical protein